MRTLNQAVTSAGKNAVGQKSMMISSMAGLSVSKFLSIPAHFF
jgi:hypothetical protein